MMAAALVLILILYTVLAAYAGNRVLAYRSDWLDSKSFPNCLVRFILNILVGYVAACFYLGKLFFKLVMIFILGR